MSGTRSIHFPPSTVMASAPAEPKRRPLASQVRAEPEAQPGRQLQETTAVAIFEEPRPAIVVYGKAIACHKLIGKELRHLTDGRGRLPWHPPGRPDPAPDDDGLCRGIDSQTPPRNGGRENLMSNRRRPSPARLEKQCSDFNAKYPVGSPVHYHSIIGSANHIMTTVREPAYLMSGHTAVCFVDGISGCVALDALS